MTINLQSLAKSEVGGKYRAFERDFKQAGKPIPMPPALHVRYEKGAATQLQPLL
jgi:hypothetical protein